MIEFSKNKWKYSTIALAAIVAVGFSFPEAIAAASTDSILTVVKDIQAKINSSVFGLSAIKIAVDSKASQTSVTGLDTKLTSIQTDIDALDLANLDEAVSTRASQESVDALQGSVDDIETDIGNLETGAVPKSVTITRFIDPSDGDSETVVILPTHANPITYSGHMSFEFGLGIEDPDNAVRVSCAPRVSEIFIPAENLEILSEGFACEALSIRVLDRADGNDAGVVIVSGVVQYFESNDVTEITG